MSNRKHLPSLFWPLSPSVQPSRPSALFKMQVHCWLVLILTSHLNLRWFLAELLLKQVLPSMYWDMGNPKPPPELQELSMAQPPGLSMSLPFVSHSGIQSSKGRFPFMVEGCTIWLHYFKNLNGNITLITVGLTQWVSSSEAKNTMKHLFMIMAGDTLYFHTCHFVRLSKSWLQHHLLGIFSIHRPARLKNLSGKHHFLTFEGLGPASMKSFVSCGERWRWILPPLLEGHV